MSINGTSGILEDFDEAFAGVAEFDDESFDDELFDERKKRRGGFTPPFRPTLQPSGPGVQSATIATPRGNATMRLPEPVVTERAFKESIQKIEGTINTLTKQVADTGSALADVRSGLVTNQKKLIKATKDQLIKLKKSQQSQAMMSMLVAMMSQQSVTKRLSEHTHSVTLADGTSVTASAPGEGAKDNSTMMMLLPLMMMGDSGGGGGGDNSMMMLMMVMAFSGMGK